MSPLSFTSLSLPEVNQHLPNGWRVNSVQSTVEEEDERRICKACKKICSTIVKCCCGTIKENSQNNMTEREEKTNLNKCPMWKRVWNMIKKTSKNNKDPEVWIFGYGSLVWLPKFSYESSKVGYVKGHARRFWQGNVTHRGRPGAPGCVATLVEDVDTLTWGVSYLLKGEAQINNALKHLLCREVDKGGYDIKNLQFLSPNGGAVEAITFVATPDNDFYLGPSSVEELAKTIVAARGASGHNLEYLFNLTDSLRDLEHADLDCHLQELEDACHKLLSATLLRSHQSSTSICNLVDKNDQYVLQCVTSRRDFLKQHAKTI